MSYSTNRYRHYLHQFIPEAAKITLSRCSSVRDKSGSTLSTRSNPAIALIIRSYCELKDAADLLLYLPF
jgi:hypothetical protein